MFDIAYVQIVVTTCTEQSNPGALDLFSHYDRLSRPLLLGGYSYGFVFLTPARRGRD